VKWVRRRPAVAALVVVSVAATLVLSVGGVWSHTRLRESLRTSHRHLYAAHMNAALDAWWHGDVPRVMELLEAHVPQAGAEDLRGFEWFHLWHLCHRERFSRAAHLGTVQAIAFSPDGKCLATGGQEGTIRLWDAVTGESLDLLVGKEMSHRPVDAVRFGDNGRLLIGLCRAQGQGEPNLVTVWEVASREERANYRESGPVALSPNGRWLAIGEANGAVKVRDLTMGKDRSALPEHKRPLRSLVFSPDDKHLAAVSEGLTVRLWDVPAGAERASLEIPNSSLTGSSIPAAIAAGGKRWAVIDGSHVVVGKTDSPEKQELSLPPIPSTHTILAFSPDGHTLMIGGTDVLYYQWSGQISPTSGGSGHGASGDTLRTKGYAEMLQLCDLATGRQQSLDGHTGGITALAYPPDGRTVASASNDMSVRLWDVATGRERRVLRGHVTGVSSLAFTPDGQSLASGSQDGILKVWDLPALEEPDTLTAPERWVVSAAFSPDGKTLAASCPREDMSREDHSVVKLWDLPSGKERVEWPVSKWTAGAVSFSPDGMMVAAGHYAEQVTLWSLASGQKTTGPGWKPWPFLPTGDSWPPATESI
jgi:WD40 repeat protein